MKFEFMEAASTLPGTFDAACSVEVRCGDFSGRVEGVWFMSYYMSAFLTELDKLRNLGYSASLLNFYSGCAEDPLRFEIFSSEEAGQLVVSADLSKAVNIGERSHVLKVSAAFPIDASELSTVRDDFHKLFYGW